MQKNMAKNEAMKKAYEETVLKKMILTKQKQKHLNQLKPALVRIFL